MSFAAELGRLLIEARIQRMNQTAAGDTGQSEHPAAAAQTEPDKPARQVHFATAGRKAQTEG